MKTLFVPMGTIAPGFHNLCAELGKHGEVFTFPEGGALFQIEEPGEGRLIRLSSEVWKSTSASDIPPVVGGRIGPSKGDNMQQEYEVTRAINRAKSLGFERVIFYGGGGTQWVCHLWNKLEGPPAFHVQRGHDADAPFGLPGEDTNEGFCFGGSSSVDYAVRQVSDAYRDLVNFQSRLLMVIVPGRHCGLFAREIALRFNKIDSTGVVPIIPEAFENADEVAQVIVASHLRRMWEVPGAQSLFVVSEGLQTLLDPQAGENASDSDVRSALMSSCKALLGSVEVKCERLRYQLRAAEASAFDLNGIAQLASCLLDGESEPFACRLDAKGQVETRSFGEIYPSSAIKPHIRGAKICAELRALFETRMLSPDFRDMPALAERFGMTAGELVTTFKRNEAFVRRHRAK